MDGAAGSLGSAGSAKEWHLSELAACFGGRCGGTSLYLAFWHFYFYQYNNYKMERRKKQKRNKRVITQPLAGE